MMIEDYINQYLGDYHNSWAGNPVLNHPVFQGTTQGFEQCSDLFHGFRSCYNVEPIRSMLVLNQCESLGSVWAIHLSQVNQIGSISEAIEACKMCQDRGWGVTWHHSREHTQRSQQYFVFFWNTFGIFNIYINVFHRGLKTVLSAPSLVGFRVFSSWNLEMDWLAKHTCSWLVVVVKHVENILYFWYSFLTHISSWRRQNRWTTIKQWGKPKIGGLSCQTRSDGRFMCGYVDPFLKPTTKSCWVFRGSRFRWVPSNKHIRCSIAMFDR